MLVNAACAVTSDHARSSRGGLTFGSYAEFEAALELLLDDAGVAARLSSNGAAYVASRYRWADLLDRYVELLQRVAARAEAA